MRMIKKVAKEILGGGEPTYQQLVGEEGLSRSTRWRRVDDLDQLVTNGYLNISGEYIKLSEKGLKTVRDAMALDPVIVQSEGWDGIWHVVAYDIPEECKKERNFFQGKLKSLNFYQAQESLWVFPSSCEEEVGIMANELGLTNYVAFLKTDRVPFDDKAKKHFGLK